MGLRTGVRVVPAFDPTDSTHLIVAAAQGGRSGSLALAYHPFNRIDAIDESILRTKIRYTSEKGFHASADAAVADLEMGGLGRR